MEEIQTNYPKYSFVSRLNKGEAKRFDCCTWIYRIKEQDRADYSIDVILFNFSGADCPTQDRLSYLELERLFLNEQSKLLNSASIALRTAIDSYEKAGIIQEEVIEELLFYYNHKDDTREEEWEEFEEDE